MKVRVIDGPRICNEYIWHYFTCSSVSTITEIKNGSLNLYCYLPGAPEGTKLVFGAPAVIRLPEPPSPVEREGMKTLKMTGDYFKIANFSDVQFQNVEQLDVGSITRVTIERMIEQEQPSMITFSGDIADTSTTLLCYEELCNFMDTFGIPYYFVYGNHDRVYATAEQMAAVINNSDYGYIEKGPELDGTYGNYVIDVKNKDDEIVHKVFMMDSRAAYTASEEDFEYVTSPVSGVKYNTHNGSQIYGHEKYDNIKGEQINWYKEQLTGFSHESTVITHMPLKQYVYAYEDYMRAKNNKDTSAIDAMSPIGTMRQGEGVCSSPFDSGFFDAMLEMGSTKNFISCHDHANDFSLLYRGIRLTYGVKTGDGCYWVKDGSMNGCTTLSISATGVGTLNQVYLDLVA